MEEAVARAKAVEAAGAAAALRRAASYFPIEVLALGNAFPRAASSATIVGLRIPEFAN
jgi:hypothetical protein